MAFCAAESQIPAPTGPRCQRLMSFGSSRQRRSQRSYVGMPPSDHLPERVGHCHRLTNCANPECRCQFAVCPECDNRRRYCSADCALTVRRTQQRLASRAYQGTARGRMLHADRQSRYRGRTIVTQQSRREDDASSAVSLEIASHSDEQRLDDAPDIGRLSRSTEITGGAKPPARMGWPQTCPSGPRRDRAMALGRLAPQCLFCGQSASFMRLTWTAMRR